MTKILNAATTTAALPTTRPAGVMMARLLRLWPRPQGKIAARLRYDIGELDVNPDKLRGQARPGLDLDRDLMRRSF